MNAHAKNAVKHRKRIAHTPGVHDEETQARGCSKTFCEEQYGNGRAAGHLEAR